VFHLYLPNITTMAASAAGGSDFDPRSIELVDGADGYSAEAVFSNPTTYTYDDLIMLPGFIDFTTADVKLETKLTRNITLNVPFVSSPMDTVTEVRKNLCCQFSEKYRSASLSLLGAARNGDRNGSPGWYRDHSFQFIPGGASEGGMAHHA